MILVTHCERSNKYKIISSTYKTNTICYYSYLSTYNYYKNLNYGANIQFDCIIKVNNQLAVTIFISSLFFSKQILSSSSIKNRLCAYNFSLFSAKMI